MTLPVASALIGLAALAILAWHMRRPDWREVRFSGLKFLPELAPTPRKAQRWQLRPPVRSPTFWLRMLLAAVLIWAIWDTRDLWRDPQGADRFGLRIVVDGSASMSAGTPSRFAAAGAEIERVLARARSHAGAAAPCSEIWLAGRSTTKLGETWPAGFRPDPGNAVAMRPAALIAIAENRPAGPCPISDVVIISDAPKPASTPDHMIWRMIGEPVSNVAITRVAVRRPGLLPTATELHLGIEPFGEGIATTVLRISGPDGIGLAREVDLTGLPPFDVTLPLTAPGLYRASLTQGGGLHVDDRIEINVGPVGRAPLDWRLADWPAPYAAAGADAVVVARTGDLDAADMRGRFVGLAAPWHGAPKDIGVFVEDTPLLTNINLDAFSDFAPAGLPDPLPDGFVPVIADAPDGRAMAAIRRSPRAALVPEPVRGADPESRRLALTMFYNALDWVLDRPVAPTPVLWPQPGGETLRNAHWESDTARALRPGDPLAFGLHDPAAGDMPDDGVLWPWLVLIGVLCITAERGLSALHARRRARA